MALAHTDHRRAGLLVPAHEPREIAPAHIGETGDEVLDRRGGPVAAFEIEIHAAAKRLGAGDLLEHADDFGPLLVNGRGIEIVDLVVETRAYRMCERARILCELHKP